MALEAVALEAAGAAPCFVNDELAALERSDWHRAEATCGEGGGERKEKETQAMWEIRQ